VPTRRFPLAPNDILLVNPNTGTLPLFRSCTDAEITLGIYRRHPVLIRDGDAHGNTWRLRFGALFHMANDSGLFRTVDELAELSAEFDGWAWAKGAERWMPLYEGKLLSHYDHRYSTYAGATDAQLRMQTLPRLADADHDDPEVEARTRYWVPERDVFAALVDRWDRDWLLGWRDFTGQEKWRTFIPSVLPLSAVNHKFPLVLRDRRQLIFYGPPGTGKTYLAQAICEHLTDREAIKLVQFHPAYSYEDFFEGFRPVSSADGSGVAFKLSPGPFRRLVDAARENPGTAYVLIIDEINRANLAKVFGELYFLLEYRGHAIDLLDSAGDEVGFTLPKNVYLIGTMNTADRSIALVDTAMRRRFAFTALHPSEQPTSGVLGKWLAVEGHSQTCARVLESLNGLMEDEDFKIGPSYFMRASAQTDTGLRRVWKSSILPRLEEHHYGESIDVAKRYDLARILRLIAPDEAADVGSDGDASSDPEQGPYEVF
jgi:hypothetical protein